MAASLDEIERIYRERGGDFYRFAYARTGDANAARDAVQEGFANAVRGRRRYRGSGSVDAWIARCVINAAHDEARRVRPTEDDAVTTAHETPLQQALIRDAVRRLPRRQRDALFLRYYLDLDYAAIAEALGIAVGTVSATLHAARASLAETLQEVPR
jgi:RNA polymerase sigma factor (sigma-70 family)